MRYWYGGRGLRTRQDLGLDVPKMLLTHLYHLTFAMSKKTMLCRDNKTDYFLPEAEVLGHWSSLYRERMVRLPCK